MDYKAFKNIQREYYTHTRRAPDRNGNLQISKSRMVTTWTLLLKDGTTITGFNTKRQALAAGATLSN